MRSPNVLFLITDQQRADHTGFMGNRQVRTPHLDGLAARGMVFENTWVSNPVCMPNRSTILTGRMPTSHGVVFNDRSLDWNANTFARRLKKSGYRTALIGKSHLQHGMSRNSVVPYRGEPANFSPYAPGWDAIEHADRYLADGCSDPEDFYGFSRIELSIDHGARITGHHLRWALEQGAVEADLLVEYGPDAPGANRSDEWWQIYRPLYDERFHSTNFVAERSIAFIESCTAAGEPWMLWCSFPDPHHPLTPPGEWFDRHRPEDMTLPESRTDTLADAPEHLRIFRALHPKDQRDWVTPCGFGSDRLLRQAIAATYGMIEMADDRIGRILSTLDRLGVRDDTLIVFTSDHGDMMGDHSLFLKGFMHYRGTLQVPLIIDAPGLAAGRTRSLASSIDLAPTVLGLCDVQGYDGIQGKDLAPVLTDPESMVRDCVLIEDDIAEITARLTPIPARTRTLITPEYRYTRNSKGEEQLFNLREDPDEMRDLKRIDEAVRMAMVERLADALMAADDSARGAPASEG
jgi:arylsulfatase A-like enzyme